MDPSNEADYRFILFLVQEVGVLLLIQFKSWILNLYRPVSLSFVFKTKITHGQTDALLLECFVDVHSQCVRKLRKTFHQKKLSQSGDFYYIVKVYK